MAYADLSCLREAVRARLSPHRFAHTLGVEEMAARLARLYAPAEEAMLRAAALLHDITKELSDSEQLALMAAADITLRPDELASAKIYHGITAPLVIARDFPAYAEQALLLAVRWHTTGRVGMTLTEAILCLADYIEEGRGYPACIALRESFFAADPATMGEGERRAHLAHALLCSLEATVASLASKNAPVCLDTAAACRWLKTTENPFERT